MGPSERTPVPNSSSLMELVSWPGPTTLPAFLESMYSFGTAPLASSSRDAPHPMLTEQLMRLWRGSVARHVGGGACVGGGARVGGAGRQRRRA